MNPYTFKKETYIRRDGGMNFPNFQAQVKLFADTVWQRSKEENAKGFEFFASLWREESLKHRGACERSIPSVRETEEPKEVKEPSPAKTPKSERAKK